MCECAGPRWQRQCSAAPAGPGAARHLGERRRGDSSSPKVYHQFCDQENVFAYPEATKVNEYPGGDSKHGAHKRNAVEGPQQQTVERSLLRDKKI